MSVSDPILRSLKYQLQEFHSTNQIVDDQSPYMEQFSHTMESAFLQGLKTGTWKLKTDRNEQRKRFWRMICAIKTITSIPSDLSQVVHICSSNRRLQSEEGKSRYALRYWLNRGSLPKVVGTLMGLPKEWLLQWYDDDHNSIITTEGLSEQLRSLFLTCTSSLKFELNLENDLFLDLTWELPSISTSEIVPCTELGIQVVFEEGYCVISKVKSDSVLDGMVRVGDVLVELDNIRAFPTSLGARNSPVKVWKSRNRNHPCLLCTAHQRGHGGTVYGPFRAAIKVYQDTLSRIHREWELELDRKSERANRGFNPFNQSSSSPESGYGV